MCRAAIAHAYYTAMQPPCGPTFVSVPIDDWIAIRAAACRAPGQPRDRRRSRRDEGARGRARRREASRLRRRPAVDRAKPCDLMVEGRSRRQKRRSGSARSRRAATFRNGIRNSPASCRRRPDRCPRRCATTMLWSWSARRVHLPCRRRMPQSSTAHCDLPDHRGRQRRRRTLSAPASSPP